MLIVPFLSLSKMRKKDEEEENLLYSSQKVRGQRRRRGYGGPAGLLPPSILPTIG